MGSETQVSSITVDLRPEQFARLQSIADRLGVSVESLARSSLEDLLAGPDDNFERAAEYVLKKNDELYRRLA
jgi:hypothetical protein